PKYQAAADVHVQLMLDDRLQLIAVAVVKHQWLFAEVAGRAEHEPAMTAEIERIGRKPVAPAFRRIEAIDGETSALSVGRSRKQRQERQGARGPARGSEKHRTDKPNRFGYASASNASAAPC